MIRTLKKYLEKANYLAIIIAGPSGCGKSTLVKEVAALNGAYELCVSYTTRPLTEEEQETKLYYHVSKLRFWLMILTRRFVEWNYYKGSHCYYGTPKSEINRIYKKGKVPAFDVDINGLVNLDKYFPRKYSKRLFLHVSPDEQERRLIKRGRKTDTPEKIASRLRIAVRERELMMHYSQHDPDLFSDIVDYNNVRPKEYAELLNRELRLLV